MQRKAAGAVRGQGNEGQGNERLPPHSPFSSQGKLNDGSESVISGITEVQPSNVTHVTSVPQHEVESDFGGIIPPDTYDEAVDLYGHGTPEFENHIRSAYIKGGYTGKGAIYHREAITVFFNSAEAPNWDEELNANIDRAHYTAKKASEIIKNIIFTEGPKMLVLEPKTHGCSNTWSNCCPVAYLSVSFLTVVSSW